MNETLSTKVGEWLDTVATRDIVAFAATLPREMSLLDPTTIPCLTITRWGNSNATAALGSVNLSEQSEVCQEGRFHDEHFQHGAIMVIYIADTVKKIKAQKLVGLHPHMNDIRALTLAMTPVIENDQGLSEGNHSARKTLVISLMSYLEITTV